MLAPLNMIVDEGLCRCGVPAAEAQQHSEPGWQDGDKAEVSGSWIDGERDWR
ncbi:hypothetical protein [Paenibacillus sp. LHD-38]|uniref:hypothetical protein n=1 Tax=Paenibacillus sp. LHD-38 TaxID=3072143 RepID=UPI00280C40F5|nr:hypothetical protein [Paenibacillus sp. LHD-38]MDQ8734183.1 hypothetical protein [Paenibacillus sp. LHD-38]